MRPSFGAQFKKDTQRGYFYWAGPATGLLGLFPEKR